MNSTTTRHQSEARRTAAIWSQGDERLAARVADRERVAGLAAHRGGHRLVQERHPLLPAPARDALHAELRERGDLEVRILHFPRDLERAARVLLCDLDLGRHLRPFELDRSVFRGERDSLEAALSACQPAASSGGVLARDPVLAGHEQGRARRRASVAASAVLDVRALPNRPRRGQVAEPEDGHREPVERTRVVRVRRERCFELRLRRRPVAARERLLAAGHALVPRQCHARIVANRARNRENARRKDAPPPWTIGSYSTRRCAVKRNLLASAVAATLLLVLASVASAHGGHGSCAAFGVEHVSVDAKVLQPSGQLVSQFARAGFINDHVAADHAVQCEPRPS